MSENGTELRKGAVDVSVVVCTYNRAQRIARALSYIAESATHAEVAVEVIVVDNNSHDDTKEVVARVAEASAIPVRYVFESKQGLSFARNRGLKSARGSVIAFTDDDCFVDPGWIAALWREFEVNPDVAVLGGRVDLHSQKDQPVSIRPIAERVRYTSAEQIYGLIIGANLAVRRGVAERIGGFDPALGGSRAVVADDIEFVYRALKQGLGVLYSPEPRVLHDHGRRTAEELRALGRSYVRGRGAFFCKYLLRADRTILRHLWWQIRSSRAGRRDAMSELSQRETLGALAGGAIHFVLTRARLVRP